MHEWIVKIRSGDRLDLPFMVGHIDRGKLEDVAG